MKIQQKAVETNQRNAALRSGEFERALAEVRSSGAKTTKQVQPHSLNAAFCQLAAIDELLEMSTAPSES